MATDRHPRSREQEAVEVTARPKSMMREVRYDSFAPGLSIDVDDLGEGYLAGATGQHNSESSDEDAPELSLMDGPPSDAPLVGPTFDPDHSVWEQTIDLSLEAHVNASRKRAR